MKIRLWEESDYTACKKIADSFDESTPTQEVFSELVSNAQIYIASEFNTIVWFISYKLLWNESMMLQFLRIHTDYHRKWIASKLINHVEELWRSIGHYEIFSTVLEENTPSNKLHESLGYRHVWEINFDSGKELVFLKEL